MTETTNSMKIGDMPSGMPDDILRDIDYSAAMKFVAADIEYNYGKCEISEQLVAAEKPVSFDEIRKHIPENAEYTAEEILSLYCTVATFKEAAKHNNIGELEEASLKVDEAGNIEEFSKSMHSFMRVYDDVGSRSQSRYEKWMKDCTYDAETSQIPL